MILVDDHCHLMHARYTDLNATLERARKAGVAAIICSGLNTATNREALEIARKYAPLVRCSLGIYPIDALGLPPDVESGLSRQIEPIDLDSEFEFIKKHKNEIAAVGEVGLDYHWIKDSALQKKMRDNFERIISFVESIKKPIILHTRKAEEDCVNMMMSSSIKHVVLHCFEGRKHLIKQAADKGWYFSVPTNIAKSSHFQNLVSLVNINQITTETDGPYLSPVPGEVNEPANVRVIIDKIAEIKQFTAEETANNIWLNFQRIYG